jgi:hypothetical protein
MNNLDLLIDDAIVYAEISTGTDAAWLSRRVDSRLVALYAGQGQRNKAPDWTAAEDAYLRQHYLFATDQDLGEILGRSAEAVHLRWERDLHLPARSKHPQWPNASRIGHMLGIACSKRIIRLIDEGILPGRRTATDDGYIRIVNLRTLTRWVLNPNNWIYFDTRKVRDAHLRRLIDHKRAAWGDEWLTTAQVADLHGVEHKDIERYILAGKIKAVRWNNWRILRSEATKPGLKFFKGKGKTESLILWTDAADQFLLLARALGYSWRSIDHMAKQAKGRAEFRIKRLHRTGAIPALIADMAMQYNPATGYLYADWRDHAARFPRLAAANIAFAEGRPADLPLVVNTLQTWLQWHAQTDEERDLARRMSYWNNATEPMVRAVYERITQ